MPVCPSVPLNSGDELQCPRAAQPGQGWEQLESAAADAFLQLAGGFFRFIRTLRDASKSLLQSGSIPLLLLPKAGHLHPAL